jgi:hypothetical protein
MPRGRPIRSATLPTLLLLAVAMVAALGFFDTRDLVHRQWTEPSRPTAVPVAVVLRTAVPAHTGPTEPREVPPVWYLRVAVWDNGVVRTDHHAAGVFSSGLSGGRVGWLVGTSLPGSLVALGVLALIGATVGLVRRRGGYARAVVRLLRAVGLAALVGGPVAALVEYLVARQYPELTWTPRVDRWLLAMVWVLVGGAFLAFSDLLARAGAWRAELDEVI